MFPGAIIPLEHNLAGEVGRVQIDVGKEHVARVDTQCAGGPGEKVLVQAGGNGGLTGLGAVEGSGIAADPVPGVAAVTSADSTGGQGIIDPGKDIG